jgi:single-strand DNA-binding protein
MNNTLIINGRVGKEPELRYTPSGMAVLELSIVDSYGKDDKKKSTWHNVVVFGTLAENTAGSANKGDTVLVVGRMEQDEYQKKDGTKGKTVKVVADEIGVSCRWNTWVKDKTSEVIGQVFATKSVGRTMPTVADDEAPF